MLSDEYVRRRPRAKSGPLVTVVISTYNRCEVLRYALRSALDQSYERIEVIVAGDGCTDDSEQVVASFGDPRVTWINLEENSGSQSAPNRAALRIAKGELVAYLGHDDLWRRDHIALLVADMEASGADVNYSACDLVYSQGWLAGRRFTCPPFGEHPSPMSMMHRRSVSPHGDEWPDWQEVVDPPDRHFYRALLEAGARLSRVPVLTAVKFPAVARPGVYHDHPSRDQERFSKRMNGRAFVVREVLTGILLLPLRRRTRAPVEMTEVTEPGEMIAELRRVRGLE